MGLTVKPSFSAGELDPVLWERTTLDKYKSGCATARNVVVSKTGSILSRQSRYHFVQCKIDNSDVVIYSPPGSGLVLEFGHLYVRVYAIGVTTMLAEVVTAFTQFDVGNMHFDTSGVYVYIFVAGKTVAKFDYFTYSFIASANIFQVPDAPTSAVVTPAGTPAGYSVEYAVTYILNGEESLPLTGIGSYNVPIAAGQLNGINILLVPVAGLSGTITEMRVYRRPASAGAYGYIGSSSYFTVSGGNAHGVFNDLGADADYTHGPPTTIMPFQVDPTLLVSKTGVIYQQRLLITDAAVDLEAVYASQPGYQNDFYRNYPLDSASALKFKAGTSGYARVLRMLDSDGLVVFTSAGIYLNQGELGPDNLALTKKGRWIINDALPPLAVPGGVLFVDRSTNSVRNLLFSFQIESFQAEEVSIYSNHLFRSRQISSWGFQEGAFPLLWVVFTDGTCASFTFEFDQQMKAWTRHDSAPIISIRKNTGTIQADTTYFVVSKVVNGVIRRYIEYTAPRYNPAFTLPSSYNLGGGQSNVTGDPQADLYYLAYMDSMVSYKTLLNIYLGSGDFFSLAATTQITNDDGTSGGDDWSGPLNMSVNSSPVFSLANGFATVGNVLRIFDLEGSQYDLTVLSRTDDENIVVQPNISFDPSLATGSKVYLTYSVLTGLSHLEGEFPAVVVDGAVVCSPNNAVDNYPEIQVIDGTLTLPTGIHGAIVHVGRPIVGDVETLDIDTVEQAPTLIESLNVNKLYIKVHKSQGLYVGNSFPMGDTNEGMESLDSMDLDYSQDEPIIGNRAQLAQTKRVELTLPGNWKSQGKICIRQVDPIHFEILSIIPDVEVLTRSDR